MSLQDPNLSNNSTIYNYTLKKRIYHSLYKVILYFLLLISMLIYQLDKSNWIAILISYPILVICHFLIVRSYFQFTIGSAMRGWAFKWGIFWCGILPEGNASIRLVSKVQQHLFWICLACIGGLYPWVSYQWLKCFLIFHLWMMMPRLWMLYRFRPFRKNGLIKMTPKDTSCYMQ